MRIGIKGLEGIAIIVMNSYIIGQFLSLIHRFYLLFTYSTGICALGRDTRTALSSHEVITKYDSTFKEWRQPRPSTRDDKLAHQHYRIIIQVLPTAQHRQRASLLRRRMPTDLATGPIHRRALPHCWLQLPFGDRPGLVAASARKKKMEGKKNLSPGVSQTRGSLPPGMGSNEKESVLYFRPLELLTFLFPICGNPLSAKAFCSPPLVFFFHISRTISKTNLPAAIPKSWFPWFRVHPCCWKKFRFRAMLPLVYSRIAAITGTFQQHHAVLEHYRYYSCCRLRVFLHLLSE